EKDFTGRRFGLLGNCNLLDGIPSTDGFYSLYLPAQRDVWLRMFFAESFPESLADFLAISRISTNLFEWKPRASALPLLTIGASPRFANPPETMERLMQPAFDARNTVFLPLDAAQHLSVSNGCSAQILSSSVSNSRITATTESSAA